MDDHAVVVADAAGVIQFWSRKAEAFFGYAAPDAVGQKLDLIVPEQYREAHWKGFSQAMTTGKAQAEGTSFDLPINCRSGVTPFPATFRLIRDASNAVIGAMLICTAPK
jgi:PAS domain S-box-containing protein